MLFKLLSYLFLFTLFFSVVKSVYAQEGFKNDYIVEYFLNQNLASIDADVKFSLKITNLKSDVYIKKVSLSFPKSFLISGLTARDDLGKIEPKISSTDQNLIVELEFLEPKVGKETQNNFFLQFKQENLFKVNGNVWEVILPTINAERNSYQAIVHLPKNTSKKISIAKPAPTQIKENTIFWNNPKTRTIYAVFGDKQIYEIQLQYNLQNPKLYRVYTDIAFPPDTLYQKIFTKRIKPKPTMVYLDEDGNYMGRYYLNPKEAKTISYVGFAEIYSKPRSEMVQVIRNSIINQKKYLLNETQYWRIKNVDKYANLKNLDDIYYYVTRTLKYNYQKATSKAENVKRLGSELALEKPTLAVCTEFTDSFVALAREKGHLSREIEGYGFSQDNQLRPLSLVSDVLHSWPEYYDPSSQLWKSIDPTWENTSGIDYLNSFDLNHIVFVVHGKRSDYPLAAGMYKVNDTRDVQVHASTQTPNEIKSIKLKRLDLNTRIDSTKPYKATLIIKNESNVFVYNTELEIVGEDLTATRNKILLEILAPDEEKKISFDYQAKTISRAATGKLIAKIGGEKVAEKVINIIPYYRLITTLSLFLIVFSSLFFLFRFIRSRS